MCAGHLLVLSHGVIYEAEVLRTKNSWRLVSGPVENRVVKPKFLCEFAKRDNADFDFFLFQSLLNTYRPFLHIMTTLCLVSFDIRAILSFLLGSSCLLKERLHVYCTATRDY